MIKASSVLREDTGSESESATFGEKLADLLAHNDNVAAFKILLPTKQ